MDSFKSFIQVTASRDHDHFTWLHSCTLSLSNCLERCPSLQNFAPLVASAVWLKKAKAC